MEGVFVVIHLASLLTTAHRDHADLYFHQQCTWSPGCREEYSDSRDRDDGSERLIFRRLSNALFTFAMADTILEQEN